MISQTSRLDSHSLSYEVAQLPYQTPIRRDRQKFSTYINKPNSQKLIGQLQLNDVRPGVRRRKPIKTQLEYDQPKSNAQITLIQRDYQIRSSRFKQTEQQKKKEQRAKYQRIISERKRHFSPINMEEILLHEKNYLNNKSRMKKSYVVSEQNPYSPPRTKTEASKYIEEELQQRKNKISDRFNSLRGVMLRRKEYGELAWGSYRDAKVSYRPSKYDVLEQRNKQLQELFYMREAKKPRKEPCPPLAEDPVKLLSRQIDGIVQSDREIDQKLQKLNRMSKNFISKYQTTGKEQALELAAKANIALAELYLSVR